ncbi:unnamed protein product [Lathyrus oleraceus]
MNTTLHLQFHASLSLSSPKLTQEIGRKTESGSKLAEHIRIFSISSSLIPDFHSHFQNSYQNQEQKSNPDPSHFFNLTSIESDCAHGNEKKHGRIVDASKKINPMV